MQARSNGPLCACRQAAVHTLMLALVAWPCRRVCGSVRACVLAIQNGASGPLVSSICRQCPGARVRDRTPCRWAGTPACLCFASTAGAGAITATQATSATAAAPRQSTKGPPRRRPSMVDMGPEGQAAVMAALQVGGPHDSVF